MSAPNDRSEATARLNAALEGRYRIREEIGRGGMATVYLADDLRHGRPVALKVLDPKLAAALGADRFLAEIRTTANLQHPHILPLFDSGEADGFLFYVMPLVEGESLRDRLDRDRQLPVENAVQLAKKLADALDYAHRHGVIHRDIKPGNVLLHDGEPVLADFGIALAMESVAGNRLTETGRSLGTPQYMSPEQATGDQHVGPAADIYALGCVLYETLVGEPPFHGSTPQAILGRIITEAPPSATQERASVPEHVDSAIRKALEKLPADRFQTAGEMSAALSDPGFVYGPTVVTGQGSSLLSRGTALFALWALAATGAALWGLTRPAPPDAVERWITREPLLRDGLGWTPRAVASDGASLLVARSDGQLWLKARGALRPEPIVAAGRFTQYTGGDFSPDGTQFVFVADGELKVVDVEDDRVSKLSDSAFCCPRWERDGFVYFTDDGRGIARVPLGGGSVEPVTRLDSMEVDPHSDFVLLPSGDAGVFYRWGPTHEPQIQVLNLETGQREPLIAGRKPYVTPDGELVYWQDDELRVQRFDERTLSLVGAPITVETGVGSYSPGGYPQFAVSHSGTLLRGYRPLERPEAQLFWVSRTGEATPVDSDWSFPAPGFFNFGWSLSPGEDRIATFSRSSGNVDVWIKELPNGPFTPFTVDPALDADPSWSPDGREVLFVSDRGGGNIDLWSRIADGSEDARVLHDLDDVIAYGFWSPDRRWLVMRTRSADGGADIVAAGSESDGGLIDVAATPAVEMGPALSPDGRWLAYSSDASGRPEVYVVGFPDLTGPWRISDEGGIRPVWAHSGEELFYVRPEAREMVSVQLRISGVPAVTRREVLFAIPEEYHVQPNADFYSVSQDDQRFLMGITERGTGDSAGLLVVRNWWAVVEQAQPN